MYIMSRGWRLPGIDPRTPTVSGWSEALQTLMVAHSCRDCSSECPPATLFPVGLEAAAATAGAGTTKATAPKDAEIDFQAAIRLKIAPVGVRARRRAPGEPVGAG